jgi:hypothetical protein
MAITLRTVHKKLPNDLFEIVKKDVMVRFEERRANKKEALKQQAHDAEVVNRMNQVSIAFNEIEVNTVEVDYQQRGYKYNGSLIVERSFDPTLYAKECKIINVEMIIPHKKFEWDMADDCYDVKKYPFIYNKIVEKVSKSVVIKEFIEGIKHRRWSNRYNSLITYI